MRINEDLFRHQVLILKVLSHKVHCKEEEYDDQDHGEALKDETWVVMVINNSKDCIAEKDETSIGKEW